MILMRGESQFSVQAALEIFLVICQVSDAGACRLVQYLLHGHRLRLFTFPAAGCDMMACLIFLINSSNLLTHQQLECQSFSNQKFISVVRHHKGQVDYTR